MGKRRVLRVRAIAYLAVVTLIAAGCGSSAETAGDTGTGPPEEIPAPARIVALTADGDVVVIDLATGTREATLGSFRAHTLEESSSIYGRADDLSVLPDGSVLVSTCCEPAGGTVLLLDDGESRDVFSGWDPQVDAAGGEVAIAGIPGIAIEAAPLTPGPSRMLVGDASVLAEPAEDPAWSPDGRKLVFTAGGRLGVVDATAATLAEALFLEPDVETHWSAPAYTTEGVVAVQQSGPWSDGDSAGPSTLLAVDPATGQTAELASSNGPIRDVTVDASGRHLLWVEKGRLRWRVGEETSTLAGRFVAAAWFPAQA